VAPAAKAWVNAATLAAQRIDDTVETDYVAQRDIDKAPQARGRYHVREDTMVVAAKTKTEPALTLRRVFVWSSARAGAAAHARTKKLDRATDDLGRLQRGLGSRHYPTPATVTARLAKIGQDRRVGAYLRSTVGTDDQGKPTLTWHYDQAALDADAATVGWYALLTNLPPADADTAEVLRRYKGQEVVERRYGDFKGPLAVAPMFLHNNRRIAALITIICLALLIFSLIERAVRRAIAPDTTMLGLYPERRPARPTGRMILAALVTMRLIPASRGTPPHVPRPNTTQLRLHQLLDVDPTAHLTAQETDP